jgi:CheY-like chemotaxis protein
MDSSLNTEKGVILWVDDDIIEALRAYADELSDASYKVIMARNVDEMWSALETAYKDISLIIMDVLMPTGNRVDSEESRAGQRTGLVLIKRIKEHDSYKKIPIMIFTVVSSQETFAWAKDNDIPVFKKQDVLPAGLLSIVQKLVEVTT